MRNSTLAHQLAILQQEGKVAIASLPWRLEVLTRHAIAVFTSPTDRQAHTRLRTALRAFDDEELAELNLGRMVGLKLLLLPKSTALHIHHAASDMRVRMMMRPSVRRKLAEWRKMR